MIKDSNLTGVIKQFSNSDPTSFLSNPDQRRKIDLVKAEEVKKPKKIVVEPIEIPKVLSVPRTQPIKKTELTELPKSYYRDPGTLPGLSQRFTQDKIHEGQISKELDRELAIERDRGRAFNREGRKYT